MNKDDQILKSRDDKVPIVFSKVTEASATEESFKLAGDSECSWQKKDETFGPAKLRERIQSHRTV